MKQILQIPEIVIAIAEKGLSDKDRSMRRGILSLAQSCRVLYEPIAAVVWHNVPTLKPLVACIPGDIWENAMGNANTNSTLRPARPQDLQRLKLNAARVRVYGVKNRPNDELDGQDTNLPEEVTIKAVSMLRLICGGSTLLPNLCEANLNLVQADLLPFFYYIMPPELKVLKIAISFCELSRQDIFSQLSFFNNLGTQYPLLEELLLKFDENKVTELSPLTLAEIITSAQWQKLSSLRIEGRTVSYSALLPLLHSKTIRNIRISFPSTEKIPEGFESTKNEATSIFPNLESLAVDFSNFSQAIEFFNLFTPNTVQIRSISVIDREGAQSSATNWQHLCECIRSTFSMIVCLKDLHLKDDNNESASYSLSLKEISPLQDFIGLQTVKIHPYGFPLLDDTDITSLAEAWPHLRIFEMVGGGCNIQSPRATLNALIAFARFCPKLEELGIEVNALVPQTSVLGQRPPPRGNSLKEFRAYMSPIARPAVVAAFISDIFPEVMKINSGWKKTGEDTFVNEEAAEAWEQVNDLVTIFAQVRREEVSKQVTV